MRAIERVNKKIRLNRDSPIPERGGGEFLIRVLSAGICGTDLEIRKGYMGFEGIPGHEFVGRVVEDGGEGMVGARVVSEINCGCGKCDYCLASMRRHCPARTVIGISGRPGAFADYIVVPAENVHRIPDVYSDLLAVLVEPFAAALKAVEDGDLSNGHRLVILGDGRLGIMVSLAARLEGYHPLLLGKHPEKLAFAERAGVEVRLWNGSFRTSWRGAFDRVFDCTGNPEGIGIALDLVKPMGRVVMKTTISRESQFPLASLVINEVELVGSRCGDFTCAIPLMGKVSDILQQMITAVYDLEAWEGAFQRAADPDSLKVIFHMAE